MKNYFTLLAIFLLVVSTPNAFSQTPQWHYLGDTIIDETSTNGILISLEGDAPYLAYQAFNDTSYFWKIKRFDGFSWIDVDTNGLGYQNFLQLGTTANGVLQIAYQTFEGNKFGIKRLLGGNWETVSESPEMADNSYYLSYDFDDESFYIAFSNQGLALGNKITVWKYAAGIWSIVGPAGFSFSNAYPVIIKVDNGTPWVTYEDWTMGRAGVVKKFDGNIWQTVGAQVYDGDSKGKRDFAVSNGIPYIAHADSSTQKRASVRKFDGVNWSNVGPATFTERTNYLKLAINAENQEPYLLFQDQDSTFWGLSALHFDGSTWGYVGNKGFISTYWSLEFVINDGVPYVGYERSVFGGGASVQVFSPVSQTFEPDAANFFFKISPNPLANAVLQLKIQSSRASDIRAKIFNMDGRIVQSASWSINAGESDQKINVGALAKGVYIVQVKSSEGQVSYTKKFVVAQ